MTTQNAEAQYDIIDGKIVEITPENKKIIEMRATMSVQVAEPKRKRISAQRRQYILRGSDEILSVAGENSKQIKLAIDTVIDMLEGIVRLGLTKLEQHYDRVVDNILSQPSSEYREASPVIKVDVDVIPVAGDFMLRVTLHEARGHKEAITIRSFTPSIENVLTGLRVASRRLATSK